MFDVHLKQNAFGRWIIVAATDPTRGWSGSRFVDMDEQGFGRNVQVSNFEKRKTAVEFARLEGFQVVEAENVERDANRTI